MRRLLAAISIASSLAVLAPAAVWAQSKTSGMTSECVAHEKAKTPAGVKAMPRDVRMEICRKCQLSKGMPPRDAGRECNRVR